MQRFIRAAVSKGAIALAASLLFQTGLPNLASAQDNSNRYGNKPEYERREALLTATVNQVLNAIRAHNGSAVLQQIDRSGISVWGGDLSPAEVGKEFKQKSGLYCLLFSTTCIAGTKFPDKAYINTSKWKISYSEWLARHSPVKIEPEMFYGGEQNPCHANVSIRSVSSSLPDELTFELGFDYRRGSWKLVSTPAYPEGIASLSPQPAPGIN